MALATNKDDKPMPEFMGIQDIAKQLGITHRTLRFYEDKDLITPQRVGTTRIYTKREIGRMQLILRGKRLGFTLKEIKEFLHLYDADPTHIEQMRHLIDRVHHRTKILKDQQKAIIETIKELEIIEQEALERIKIYSQQA